MPICDPRERFFYPTLTLMMDSYMLPLELINVPGQLVPQLSVHPTLPLSWASTDETKQSHHLIHKQWWIETQISL